MRRITRIAYNSNGWRKPTGDARKLEAPGTHNHEHGFGFEDWLFRSEWRLDFWHYAFIQGVNKGRERLLKQQSAVDLTLFTIRPDKKRQFVATIRDAECLSDDQADAAIAEYKRCGWYKTMRQEIKDVGGDANGLNKSKLASKILNVRFRVENVVPFPNDTFADPDDPITKLMRYQLFDPEKVGKSPKRKKASSGSTKPPATTKFWRKGAASKMCNPEHAMMQKRLMEELKAEYPDAKIVREKDFVDVSVKTPDATLLFEIKSDLEPRTVIRQALGQILEYAYLPSRKTREPVRLFIVGRRSLSPEEENYLARLRDDFSLPVEYRVVELGR